jgi:osmotically-inducible protein OsmY
MPTRASDPVDRAAAPVRIDPSSADVRLERAIARRLGAVTVLDASTIVVSCTDGRVALRGSVGSFSERLMCFEVAAALAGHGAVTDELHVRAYDEGWQLGPGAVPTTPA